MKKPFQVVRINPPKITGSRKDLLLKLSKTKDPVERNKILQNALYPNILKRVDEEEK